jgi:hypothetical protein
MEDSTMNWPRILDFLGGSAAVAAGAGIAARVVLEHLLKSRLEIMKAGIEEANNLALESFKKTKERELEETRQRHERELNLLRSVQEKALAEFQAWSAERMARVTATLAHVERLESEILKGRGEAYGAIWKLTGSTNLFGPPVATTCAQLSIALLEWYFAHGWLLTEEAKRRYFLLQEVLNFLNMRGLQFKRPPDEQLYGDSLHPLEVVRGMRAAILGVPDRSEKGSYSIKEMEEYVRHWKCERGKESADEAAAQAAWLIVQFVMSEFRSRLAGELGSRSSVQTLATQSGSNQTTVQTLASGAAETV